MKKKYMTSRELIDSLQDPELKLKRKTRDMLNKCKNPALIRKIYILLNSQS